MKEYICEKCNKEFDQKIDYTRHINKKYPCITQEELKNGKLSEDESLKELDSFFNKIRDILRNNENITGHKALDVITDFLLLRLLNHAIDNNQSSMDFTTKKYNKSVKIDGTDIEYDLDEYKKYFKWDELMKLVKEIDKTGDIEKKELLDQLIKYVIFSGILKFHDQTREIYKNKKFILQKTTTILRLLKEFDKIQFDKYDADIKGKAYELTLQKEGSTNKEFGQFFTPRWIDKYLVQNADIEIDKKGNYTKCLDPACGTAGILTEYLSNVYELADKSDILLNKNVSDFIHGFEIVDDTIRIAHMNILVKSNFYDKNIHCIDFLEHGCFDFEKEMFDGNIITNPPFALTKNYESLFENKKMYPIKSKSGINLFLQSCTKILKDGRKCIMISPNGKEIFGKNKEFINLRKHIVTTCNLYKIALLPSGAFKPYTGVETLVLMMKKGEQTKEIQFVKVEKNKDDTTTETKICKVKFEELEKHNYSWNYKEYYEEKKEIYGDLEYKKIKEIVEINYGDRITKKDTMIGNIPVYGGGDITFYTNKFNRDGINWLISRFGMSEKCIRKVYGKIWLNDSGMTIKSINEQLNNEYVNLYLMHIQSQIFELGEGSAQKNINMEKFKNIKIPIPPLPVQNLIVKELDSMYKQKESIQTAINNMNTTRKAKFELLLRDCKDKKVKKLGDVIKVSQGEYISKDKAEEGKYPIYGGGNISGYNNKYNRESKYVISKDGVSEICIRYVDGKFFLNHHAWTFDILNKLDHLDNFIGIYLLNIQDVIFLMAKGTAQKGINQENFYSIKIQLPSKEDQERIVKEMEKFDKLEELQKEHIIELDKIIKERFEYHLNECKKIDKKKETIKEEDDSEESDTSESDSSEDTEDEYLTCKKCNREKLQKKYFNKDSKTCTDCKTSKLKK